MSPVNYEVHTDEIQSLMDRTSDFNNYASKIYSSVDTDLETFARELSTFFRTSFRGFKFRPL